jgi:UDP-N-acetylglucosamine 1-carboxyvinyltransferase
MRTGVVRPEDDMSKQHEDAYELVIRGGRPLEGCVEASGSKNAALPIMAASLLLDGPSVLHRVPHLRDVDTISGLLEHMGVLVERTARDSVRLTRGAHQPSFEPCELVREMRGSICVLGPLLATRGAAVLPMPGGCVLGERPIDLHVKGLRALGADVTCSAGYVLGRADHLHGACIDLAGPHGSTALGTANVMMAATLAEGRTVIESAAREPEIQDLARFLNRCGARITGIGTPTLTIDGVQRLHGAEHTVIPDRIEAGTLLCAAAACGGRVVVTGTRPDHMIADLDVLDRMGVGLDVYGDAITARCRGRVAPVEFRTGSYPAVPTDLQPQLTTLCCVADGRSTVWEDVYPDRFTHMDALMSMGAHMARQGPEATIQGVPTLEGASVTAADLRGGAALVLAGLAARGTTVVAGVDQIDRGYQALEDKLASLGADIARVPAGTGAAPRRKTA